MVRNRLTALFGAGIVAASSGCAVHHYHHYVQESAPTLPDRAPVPGSPTKSADFTTVHPPIIAAALKEQPATIEGNPAALLPIPKKLGEWIPNQPKSLPSEPNSAPVSSGMTLDQIINTTILADPKLRSGLEKINQAHADALTASLRPNPDLYMDGQLIPLTRPFTVDQQGGPPQMDIYLSYSIDWFLFGKRAAEMQAAGLGVRVSEADYADRVRTRVLEAATAYYDVLEAKGLLDLARQDVESLKRVEGVTQKAVDLGGKPQVELNRVRLDRLRSEQALRDAESALVGATARLRAVMGREGAEPSFEVSGKLEDQPPVEPLPDEEALAIARENRPDIRSDHWQIAQSRSAMESERRKAFPKVTPQVGYTRQYQMKAIGFPDADSYLVALTVSLPIFDRNQGNRAKAASLAVQNEFDLRADLVALRAEVVQATQELRTASANVRAVAGDQLKLAGDVRESLTKAYEAGGRPLLDVLDAQRNYRDTYRLFVSGRANYGRAVVKYYSTLGKRSAP